MNDYGPCETLGSWPLSAQGVGWQPHFCQPLHWVMGARPGCLLGGREEGRAELRERPPMLCCLMSGQRPHPLHPALVLSGHALGFNKAKEEKPAPRQPAGRSRVRTLHMHITHPLRMPSQDRDCLPGAGRGRWRSHGPGVLAPVHTLCSASQASRPPPLGPEALNRSTLHKQAFPWVTPPSLAQAGWHVEPAMWLAYFLSPSLGCAVWHFFPLH